MTFFHSSREVVSRDSFTTEIRDESAFFHLRHANSLLLSYRVYDRYSKAILQTHVIVKSLAGIIYFNISIASEMLSAKKITDAENYYRSLSLF